MFTKVTEFIRSKIGLNNKIHVSPEPEVPKMQEEDITANAGSSTLDSKNHTRDAESCYEEGNRLSGLGKYVEALECYNLAISQKHDYAIAYNKKGHVLCDLGKNNEAFESYSLAVDYGYTAAHNNKGNALRHLGRYEEAIASYDEAIRLDPDSGMAYNGKGNALYDLGRYEEALREYDIAIGLGYITSHNNKGNALDDLGRYEEAIASYDEAIRLDPDSGMAYNGKGIALHHLGRYEEAIVSYSESIKRDPDNAGPYKCMGDALFRSGRHEEALSSYEKAIEIDPNWSPSHNGKGNALNALEKYLEALDAYDKAIEINTNEIDPYNGKGETLCILRYYEEAIESHKKAIEVDPSDSYNSRSYNSIGCIFASLRNYREAIEYYDKAISLKPDNPLYYCNKGMALKNIGNEKGALECFNKALDVAESIQDAKRGLSQGNISYINDILSGERLDLLKKLSEFQEVEIETKKQLAGLDHTDEKVKKAISEFNNFAIEHREILDSALDNITGKSFQENQMDLLMAQVRQMKAYMLQMQDEMIFLKSRVDGHDDMFLSLAEQIKVDHEVIQKIMNEVGGDAKTKKEMLELMPFLGDIKKLIDEKNAEEINTAIYEQIERDPYSREFESQFRKILTSTHLASMVVDTQIVKNNKVGLLGKFGKLLEAASNYVPVFGVGVGILSLVLTQADQMHQNKLLGRLADFTSLPREMEELSGLLSTMFLDIRLNKSHLDEGLNAGSMISNMMNGVGISFGIMENSGGNRHGDMNRNSVSLGWEDPSSKGGGEGFSGGAQASFVVGDDGRRHAKILSTFVLSQIFNGNVTNESHDVKNCVLPLTLNACAEFNMASEGDVHLVAQQYMEGYMPPVDLLGSDAYAS